MGKNLRLAGWAAALLLGLACSGTGQDRDALQGVVELHERVLGFELPGRLLQRRVERGQAVKRGEVVAVLDDGLERPLRDARAADVAAAQAQLELLEAGTRSEDLRAAEANVRAAKASEGTLAEDAQRARQLRATHAIPQEQLDQAEGALRRATAEREAAEQRLAALRAGSRRQEIRAAQARLTAAQAALALEDARLAEYTLRAPIDGEVLDTHAEPGEVLGGGAPVVTLGEVDRPYIDLFVPEARVGEVRVGAPVEVTTDAAPGERFAGAVEYVGQDTEFTPRYLFSPKERPNLVVRVRVALRDPKHALRAGLPAFATLSTESGARP